jgi:hypothetical protein
MVNNTKVEGYSNGSSWHFDKISRRRGAWEYVSFFDESFKELLPYPRALAEMLSCKQLKIAA